MARVEGLSGLVAALKKKRLDLGKERVSVITGFNARYAIFLHENIEMRLAGQPRPSGLGNYWDPPGSGPKFLEGPARELSNDGTLRQIVLTALQKGVSLVQSLVLAGLRIQRESQARTPVEYSNLKNSAFTEVED